ncbi:hypothetical protein [Cytobacillus solani]|uniref:Uncharacterized protein n=2 Tax=Cytobacillus solani TaxID=1637975 RepID=A0A0Q3T9R8_9BACI|nr:hypothetical protein [Cytobacillus solani]KOP83069.1 hypothetical protein AMS60_11665 [Bacillus sp. FJAT-21945]KQL20093.1 hypothetical protein AN957_16975 [Cytobacillus solani]
MGYFCQKEDITILQLCELLKIVNEMIFKCEIYLVNETVYCIEGIVNEGEMVMNFNLNRINPNQTQVLFHDGRFETLTNEELEDLMAQMGISERADELESNVTD